MRDRSKEPRSMERKRNYLRDLEWTALVPQDVVIHFLELSIEENKDGAGFNGVTNLVERSHIGYAKLRSALKDDVPHRFNILDMDKLASISYSFNLEDVYDMIFERYPSWPVGWDDPRKQLKSEDILRELAT